MADYLEGDLSLGKRALFDAHLDACADCSSELSEMRGTISLLRRLPAPEPPSDLTDNVMRRIAEGEGQPGLLDRIERWFAEFSSLVLTPRFVVPATAVAAGLAVVVVTADGGGSLPGLTRQTPVAQVAQAPRPNGPAAQQRREPQLQGFGDARGRMRVESLAQNNTRPGRVRLGLRGSRLAGDGLHAPPARRRAGAGPQSLELASASTAGTAKAESPRTRDEWLDVLIQQPQAFAREHTELSSVERELWITHLSRRAVELGRLEEAVTTLRATADPVAVLLADSFADAGELR